MNEDEIPGPVWKDHCNHRKEEYVGSFVTYSKGVELKHDLYVFEDFDLIEQHTCIRCGNEPQEYSSPGPLYQLIEIAARNQGHLDEYNAAVSMLKEKGKITWNKR